MSAIKSISSLGPPDSFVDSLSAVITDVLVAKSLEPDSLSGIGVAVAGFINDDRDRMIYNPNLPWLEGYPLRERLTGRFQTFVCLEVDSNAAALAEQRFGVGRESSRFLCIAVGTGIGVGMIINGEPLRFAYGCIGDPGHIVLQRNGPDCPCGGRGCAEIFVSAPVLAEQYRRVRALKVEVSLRDVITAARDGDEVAIQILETAGSWLGVATASFANTFFPDCIAIAGGLAEAGDFVMQSIQESFSSSASKFARDQVTMHRAVLGANATITGAACAMNNFSYKS